MGEGTVRFFGEPWGAPVNDFAKRVDVPVGESCIHCPNLIVANDRGVRLPSVGEDARVTMANYHLGCWMESILGPNWRDLPGLKSFAEEINGGQ